MPGTVPGGGGEVNASLRVSQEVAFPRLTDPSADGRLPAPLLRLAGGLHRVRHGRPAPPGVPMKLKVRRSKLKRLKKVGFRTRSKTTGGRKVIKRKIKRSGKFRVG